MNRLNISMLLPSLDTGGAESMAYQLATSIDKEKFKLQFVCLSGSKGTAFEKEISKLGVRVIHLNKKQGLNIATFFKVWKVLNLHKPDVLHTHLGASLYVFPWVLVHNVKLIHTIHNTPLKELPFLHRFLLKILYKTKKAVPVAISDTIKNQVSELYSIKHKEIPVVYNPVNIKKYTLSSKRNSNDKITFVCVARLSEQKNHLMLLKSFFDVKDKIKNSVLLIAGEGELEDQLKREVKRLKLDDSVKFLGNVENVSQLLHSSDVFVLTSHYEGLPMTILEAMAAGLPVIATKVGGIPDIVKNNGILVEKNDVAGFAKAMIKLGQNKTLQEKMGTIGYKMTQNYDLSRVKGQYEDLYIKCLRKNKSYE